MADICILTRKIELDDGGKLSIDHAITDTEIECCRLGIDGALSFYWRVAGEELDKAERAARAGKGDR